jgi:hypothetical protein
MKRWMFARRSMIGAAGVLALTAGVALAAWTVHGSGTGSAKAATALDVTLTNGTPATSLFPGGAADVATQLANPNPFPVHVSSIALDSAQGSSGFSVDGAHSGCDVAVLSLPAQTNGGSGWDVPAHGSLAVALTAALQMSNAAVDACQGATFTAYLTVAAASA